VHAGFFLLGFCILKRCGGNVGCVMWNRLSFEVGHTRWSR
jgi:hypothetical protein